MLKKKKEEEGDRREEDIEAGEGSTPGEELEVKEIPEKIRVLIYDFEGNECEGRFVNSVAELKSLLLSPKDELTKVTEEETGSVSYQIRRR